MRIPADYTPPQPVAWTGGSRPPCATQCDIEMLRDKGIDYIKGNLLYGVIDRLQTSGIIPTTTP